MRDRASSTIYTIAASINLRVSARADGLHLDYVRTYLPGEGPDGEVAFSHVFR